MHKALRWAACLGLAFTLSGCTVFGQGWSGALPATSSANKTSELQLGASSHSVIMGGQERTFIVYRPAAPAPARGYPVVVMLHGGLGSARQAEYSYGWDAEADAHGFIVVYPEGIGRTWNAGAGCCGIPAKQDINDVDFIVEALDQTARLVPTDSTRTYATGMSNGAMMAFRLACETSLFSAIAPVAGTQLVSCVGAQPRSLLEIHGSADKTVRPDGQPGTGPAHVDGPPLTTVLNQWRERDHCARPRTTKSGKVTTTTATCANTHTVESIMIAGAGHQWPGSTSSSYPGADQPSKALNATETIWAFFARHPA